MEVYNDVGFIVLPGINMCQDLMIIGETVPFVEVVVLGRTCWMGKVGPRSPSSSLQQPGG